MFFYLEDQERKMDTATDKLIPMIKNCGVEFERERASQRTHDKLLQKARAGHVVGCKVFGYDNVEVAGPDGTRQHVIRHINPTERAIVLRIFEMYCVDGIGIHAIAKALNDDGVPPPRGQRRGWAGSCVRAILLCPLYRGIVVWNKTKAISRGGTKTSVRCPQAEWETIDAPDLRIVRPDLWAKVEAKFARSRAQYVPLPYGAAREPSVGADLRSQYLLSGLAQAPSAAGPSSVSFGGRRTGRTPICAPTSTAAGRRSARTTSGSGRASWIPSCCTPSTTCSTRRCWETRWRGRWRRFGLDRRRSPTNESRLSARCP